VKSGEPAKCLAESGEWGIESQEAEQNERSAKGHQTVADATPPRWEDIVDGAERKKKSGAERCDRLEKT